MKPRFLFIASSMLFSSYVLADYSSHQFHYMEMELKQCKQIVSDAAEKIGFLNIGSQENSYGKNQVRYAILFGKNKEGYSFQYTCEPVKGFGYLIINGTNVDVKNKLRDSMSNEIEKIKNK